MDKRYAHSILEVKAMEEGGKRIFKGIATTPTADRVGDIVVPEGAEFKLPIPLCWMHDTTDPVGWVTAAKVSKAGIEIEAEIASISEPASLKDRLDKAWAMLTGKLVRGLSIGFKPLESARIGDTYSYKFSRWLWLELSPVVVPANGDCSITGIKSADQLVRRAATGAMAGHRVVRLDGAGPAGNASPGVPGSEKARRKGVIYL